MGRPSDLTGMPEPEASSSMRKYAWMELRMDFSRSADKAFPRLRGVISMQPMRPNGSSASPTSRESQMLQRSLRSIAGS